MLMLFLILCIITAKSNSQSDQEDTEDYRLNGYPNLKNCESHPDYIEYMKKQLTVKDPLPVFPEWMDSTEAKLAINPIYNYTWKYRMVEIVFKDGEEIEKPMDISEWLEDHETRVKIPAYGITPGQYKIYPSATLKNPEDKLRPFNKTVCIFFYTGLPPIVVISGGNRRIVPTSTEIKLNGEESFDPNEKKRTNENFLYSWTCTQKKQPPTFCITDVVSHKSRLRIPARFVETGDIFNVTLTIFTTFESNDSFTQTIDVIDNAAQIEITCEKNCPPVSDTSSFQRNTFLRAKCMSNCRGIRDEHYEWTIERKPENGFTFDYQRDTQFGRKGTKFFVFKDVLTSGIYSVIMKLTDSAPRRGEAVFTLDLEYPPHVNACHLIPNDGQSMLTLFKLECKEYDLHMNLYEFVVKDKKDLSTEQPILEGYYRVVSDSEFQLPPSSSHVFLLRITYQGGPPTEITINANVEKSTVSATLFDQFYNGGNASVSISTLLSSTDINEKESGVRRFHALIDQLVITKTDDTDIRNFLQDLKYKAATDILNAPITSISEVSQISDAITKLMSHDEDPKSDPLLAKFSTTVCKKMVDKQMDLLKKEKFPLNYGDKAEKVSNTLRQCLETNTNPNYDAIAPIEQDIITEKSLVNEIVVTENYDNYIDFNENYYKNMDNLKESTYNIINASTMSAKVLAMTMAAGEKFVKVFGKKSATVVAKDEGKILAKSKVRSQGVTLIPSPDFVGDDHNFDILMSTWNKDIMWWNRAKTKVVTDIASIEFWHSTCKLRIKNFNEPAQLIFKVKNGTKDKVIFKEETFFVPEEYQQLSGENLSRLIKVKRIALPKRWILRIHFLELTEVDALDVIVNNFKFPTAEDFENSTTVFWNENFLLHFVNNDEFDTWCYIGILANKNYVANNSLKSITFKFGLSVSCCVRWIESMDVWHPACKPVVVSDEDVIQCLCTNFSVIAGYVENIKSDEQDVALTELELELQSTCIIFITVAVTFALYYFVFLLILIKDKTEIYYLSDNIRKHRFAYLLSVKTGTGRNSGTTSNVVVRLVGEKKSSNAHVLNYPDPKLRLLQKFGKDMFLLTTKHHLGDLLKLELWFDCLGHSPDWFCRDITVYDMQQYTKWYFKVKKRLALIKGDSYVELEPTKTDSPYKIKFAWRYHTWYLWCKEENFTYVERLTVVLSTVLMIYALVLVFQGVPLFQLQDSFDCRYHIDVFTVLTAFVSSFSVFLLHLLFVWCFRYHLHLLIRFSKTQFLKYNKEEKTSVKLRTLCLIILATFISVSASFLNISGFWVPNNKSLIWLTTCALAVFFTCVIYESSFAFLQILLCKMELKHNIQLKFHQIWKATETQRHTLYKRLGDHLLQPYFEHLYTPMQTTIINKKREMVMHRRDVISELEDLVMFTIYIVILYVVILSNRDDLIVHGKTSMKEIMRGVNARSLDFKDVETIEGVYEYLNTTIISSLQPRIWYGNYVVSEPGMMIDMTNKYLGVVRFRQQRSKVNACTVAETMNFLQNSCVPEFSLFNAYTGLFGYATKANLAYLQFDRLKHIWFYAPPMKTGSLGTIGKFAAYPGGGYVSYLGRTLYNSYVNLRRIVGKFWIDRKSRSIFIEFLTYNANYNVFNSITLLFEQSATGYTFKHVDVYAVRMLFVQNEVRSISLMFFGFFVIWVIMLLLKQSIGVVKKIRTFYKDVWFMIDFLIVLMSIICIALSGYRMHLIKIYLDELEKVKRNEFLNYFYLFYLEDFLTVFASVLVGVATVRLWKFLRFGIMFRVLERTLSRCAVPFGTIMFGFGIILTAFSMVVVMLYGNEFEMVSTLIETIRLLATMSLKATELELLKFKDYNSAYFYFTLYSLVLNIVIVVFIMIIVMSYLEAQMEFSTTIDAYNIKHYVLEQMKYVLRLIKYKYSRLKGGESNSKVEPKSDKFLRHNSYNVSSKRMKIMQYVTKCTIRHMKRPFYLTDYDVKLMLALCRYTLIESDYELELFLKGQVKEKRVALIDDKRILMIVEVVNALLKEVSSTEQIAGTSVDTEEYDRYIGKKLKTLRRCNLLLKLILDQVDSFEVNVPK